MLKAAAPERIKSSAEASHNIKADDVSPKNLTSKPLPSVPTATVLSICTAPSISTASKFVVPSTSKSVPT